VKLAYPICREKVGAERRLLDPDTGTQTIDTEFHRQVLNWGGIFFGCIVSPWPTSVPG
jgi:hypothetical protein